MIQRKQTIYLLFVIVLFVVSFFTDIASAEIAGKSVYSISAASLYPLTIFASLSILLSIGAIATFKKSNLQLRLSITNIVMVCGYIIFEIFSIIRFFNNEATAQAEKGLEVAAFFPIVAIIFAFMAFKGISRDIFLIRSYDRMR